MLPAAFPICCRRSQGIAVGMATSIPPHNAAESCEAARLIDNPKACSRTLLNTSKGRTSRPVGHRRQVRWKSPRPIPPPRLVPRACVLGKGDPVAAPIRSS